MEIFNEAVSAIPKQQNDELVKGSCSELASFKRAGAFGLNDRKESFCRDIVKSRNIASSYIAFIDSSVKEDEAYKLGVILLKENAVEDRVTRLEENRRIVRDINKDAIISDSARICSVTAADYFSDCPDGGFDVKPMSQWTANMKIACKSIEPTKTGWKLTIHDREISMDKIAKMKGYYAAEKKDITLNAMHDKSDDELRNIADMPYEEVNSEEEEVNSEEEEVDSGEE